VFVPGHLIDTRGVHRLGGDFKVDELAGRANVVTGDAVREYRARADSSRRSPMVARLPMPNRSPPPSALPDIGLLVCMATCRWPNVIG
jgi:hypothetical protein